MPAVGKIGRPANQPDRNHGAVPPREKDTAQGSLRTDKPPAPPIKYDKAFLRKEEEYLKKQGGKGDIDGTLDKNEVKTLYGEDAVKKFDKYANKENTKGVELIDLEGLQKMNLLG